MPPIGPQLLLVCPLFRGEAEWIKPPGLRHGTPTNTLPSALVNRQCLGTALADPNERKPRRLSSAAPYCSEAHLCSPERRDSFRRL